MGTSVQAPASILFCGVWASFLRAVKPRAGEVRVLPLWLGLRAAFAGGVAVPTFTPGTVGDFGPAEQLTEVTLESLSRAKIAFIAPSEVSRRGGAEVMSCGDQPTCPQLIFDLFPGASVVIVGGTTWAQGRLETEVRFYTRGDASPVEILTATFRPEDSGQFADEVGRIVDELLTFSPGQASIGPAVAKEPDPAVSARAGAAPSRDRLGDEPIAPPPDASEQERAQGPMPRAWYALPPRSQTRFVVSGMEWREWRRQKALRTGRFEVGLLGGMSFGDISRRYDVRVALNEPVAGQFEAIGSYEHQDFEVDRGFSGGLWLSFAPAWWLDVGVVAGLQTGEKRLSTGWEQYVDGELFTDPQSVTHDPALAVMGHVEPRLRLFFAPLGTVKPYVSAGGSFRVLDGYSAPDLATVEYADLPGSVDTALTVGGGLSFDLPMGLSLVLDVPWYWRLSGAPVHRSYEGHGLQALPSEPEPARQVLIFRGGLGFRL